MTISRDPTPLVCIDMHLGRFNRYVRNPRGAGVRRTHTVTIREDDWNRVLIGARPMPAADIETFRENPTLINCEVVDPPRYGLVPEPPPNPAPRAPDPPRAA